MIFLKSVLIDFRLLILVLKSQKNSDLSLLNFDQIMKCSEHELSKQTNNWEN